MTAQRSRPFFLNSTSQQIFTLHYPAEGTAKETIVICPPAPQEIMRAQAGLGQLARRLQEDGYNVIRFDYSSTGDSEGTGDTASIDQWLQDILQVCTFAQEQTGGTVLSLVGLRLGAALAIRASHHTPLHRLVLWDPVLDGIHYLREMEASHARMFHLNAIEPPFPSWRYGQTQCWGFPWSEGWRSQIAAVSPALLVPKAKRTHIVLSATDPIARDVSQGWQKLGIQSDLQHIGEPMYWGDERYLKIRAFPSAHVRRIQALWETQE
ncbi:MAG TPA: alpha/beta hydrolase [Oligoflexus sp.]|uniref:serine aminopeptidase domain-containing protein n=1 Tax=Oligoflexus sp. TaxID=1971216 RepID=UPI002D4F6BB1|nr:alpha/beta hydrolase [Oligoflexus sp.]HYX34952.1 alpha/beta hydrolase [Oligoflexus sp.]